MIVQIGNAIFFMPVTAARAGLRVERCYQNFVWSEARREIIVEQAKESRGKQVQKFAERHLLPNQLLLLLA